MSKKITCLPLSTTYRVFRPGHMVTHVYRDGRDGGWSEIDPAEYRIEYDADGASITFEIPQIDYSNRPHVIAVDVAWRQEGFTE